MKTQSATETNSQIERPLSDSRPESPLYRDVMNLAEILKHKTSGSNLCMAINYLGEVNHIPSEKNLTNFVKMVWNIFLKTIGRQRELDRKEQNIMEKASINRLIDEIPALQEVRNHLNRKEKDLQQLRAQINQERRQLDERKNRLQDLKRQLPNLQNQILFLEANLNELQNQKKNLNAEIASAKKELQQTKVTA